MMTKDASRYTVKPVLRGHLTSLSSQFTIRLYEKVKSASQKLIELEL
jgi:hypothetical protein